MIVLLHVVIALGSIAYTGYTYCSPTKNKLRVSAGLVILTLASGTYLVISTHSPMLTACMMGLIYLGGTSAAIISASRKLSGQEIAKN